MESATDEMRMAEKKQTRGLPPPSVLFSQNSSELFTYSYPELPLPFHSLQLTLHSAGDNTCLAFSMFRLEHPLNITPGHQAHRGKYFQMQRLAR